MRILLINGTWGLSGGQEEYLLQIGNGLTARGHQVKLIYGKFAGTKKGIERTNFDAEAISGLETKEVLRAAQAFDAEVVNIQNVFAPQLLGILNENFPTTRFVHDHTVYCPGNSKYFFNSQEICPIATSPACLINAYREKCMTRRPLLALRRVRQRSAWLSSLQHLPVVLCNSSYVKERLVQNGLKRERVLVNHLFPGHSEWFKQEVAENRRNFTQIEILFVGRLFKEKGVDLLLQALAIIDRKFNLKIVGEGWEKERLIKLSQDLGLDKKIKFLGFKSGEDLHKLYRQSSFLVLPSVWPEPFGMVGLEAHFFKKPVVAFKVGGIADWLENGVNGFLIEEVSSVALAERLEILIDQSDLRRQMGERGFQKISRQFNLDRHLDVLEEVYRNLIAVKR